MPKNKLKFSNRRVADLPVPKDSATWFYDTDVPGLAVTVSPILYTPPAPVAPEMEMLPSVTVGAMLSTVAFDVSAVVRVPAEDAVSLVRVCHRGILRFVAIGLWLRPGSPPGLRLIQPSAAQSPS